MMYAQIFRLVMIRDSEQNQPVSYFDFFILLCGTIRYDSALLIQTVKKLHLSKRILFLSLIKKNKVMLNDDHISGVLQACVLAAVLLRFVVLVCQLPVKNSTDLYDVCFDFLQVYRWF